MIFTKKSCIVHLFFWKTTYLKSLTAQWINRNNILKQEIDMWIRDILTLKQAKKLKNEEPQTNNFQHFTWKYCGSSLPRNSCGKYLFIVFYFLLQTLKLLWKQWLIFPAKLVKTTLNHRVLFSEIWYSNLISLF